MPRKIKRRSRRTVFWAWPAHLENATCGHRLVALYHKRRDGGQVRVRVSKI